jgi:CRP/FNR family transcriptional regulator
VALESSCVLSVPKSRFVAMLLAKPELFLKVLAFMSLHVQEMMRLVESVSLDKVPRRLAQALLKTAKTQGGPRRGQVVRLGRSQTALAAELGTVREVVSRSLRQMREGGIILLEGQQVTLLEPAALEKI